MPEYIQRFVIDCEWGSGYLVTNALQVCGAIILLREFPRDRRGLLALIAECLLGCLAGLALHSVYYALIGEWQMDHITFGLFMVLYAVLRSRYDFRVCLVRGWMYAASILVMLPISEPLGRFFASINQAYYAWAQYLTPVVMAVMILAEVWFLRHFSFDTGNAIGGKYVWMQLIISVITIGIELYAELTGAIVSAQSFNVLICICLWFLNLMAYYQFYTIDQGARKNMDLLALRQKAEMEAEKYHATKLNYDELRAIRHEIKNHNFYLKALLDEGKIDIARQYLERVSARGTRYLKSFDSGNYAIDVVMNHEMAAARELGVTLKPNILVPRQLPFRDEDICSLLSNLLDNAMEAAAQSGKENPEVEISILPRQEYLFFRVINPVDSAIPEKRRMTLETTKTRHTELHGFGTRIIRRIAERYHGSVKYSMREGNFITDVMLEMPEEEAQE
ncbi:MAG: sensor histidine kinase [Aristaeellaceae bacterium]